MALLNHRSTERVSHALPWHLHARQPRSRLHPTLTRTCTCCGRPSLSAPIPSESPSAPSRICGRKSSPPTRSLLAYVSTVAAACHACTRAATAAADAAGCIGVPVRSASAEKGRVLGASAPSERRPIRRKSACASAYSHGMRTRCALTCKHCSGVHLRARCRASVVPVPCLAGCSSQRATVQ
jgi:hypothetical protein